MRQIIGGSHAREQSETGNLQLIRKYRHTRHCQDIVHAQRTQEGTLSRHVGSGDDIIVAVLDGEIVLHRLGTQERMIEILTLEHDFRTSDSCIFRSIAFSICFRTSRNKLRLFCLRMIISEIRHRNHRIHLADDVHPFLHLHHIGILPFQETANQEEIAQHEGIGEEKTEEVASSVIPLQYLFQLGKGRQGICQGILHLLA